MADDDLSKLATDLSRVSAETWPFVHKALERTARHVKDDWNENLGGAKNPHSRFKHVGRSVDYDIAVQGASLLREALGIGGGGTGIQAEIGPNLARQQGTMAGWFEEGMRNIPALHPGYDAMKKNEGDYVNGLAEAVADGLKKAGL